MKSFTNECGSRNGFGYIDRYAREIILNRPCLKKADLEETYQWVESIKSLKRFCIGLGPAENFLREGPSNSVYCMAKGVFKNTITKIRRSDAMMLQKFLPMLKGKEGLRNLAFKGFMFIDDEETFQLLLDTVKNTPSLVFFSLAGGFLTDEQLIELAEAVSQTKIANMVWPEQHISAPTLAKITEIISNNQSLAVISDSPREMKEIAQRNRNTFLQLGKRNRILTEKEIEFIQQHKESVRMSITYERDVLLDMERTFEGIFMEAEQCKYMERDPLMAEYLENKNN